MKMNKNEAKGFTLLELLIVIAILAILSVTLVLVLNPAETLRKSRDTQRMSDLAQVKTALGYYMTNTPNPFLAGVSNAACQTGNDGWTGDAVTGRIYYSYPSDIGGLGASDISDASLDGVVAFTLGATQVLSASVGLNDGNGWLPVNLTGVTGGAPISNFPIDPVNTINDITNVATSDLVYRYACNSTNLTFEIDARLESTEFTSGTTNKMDRDGGNNAGLYEVGTRLDILGDGAVHQF